MSITATFNTVAVGGQFDNGLGLHLPIPTGNVSAATRTVGTGAPQALTVSSADGELTVGVSNNLREFFGGLAGPINAIDGASLVGETVQVDIERGEKRIARPVELADLVIPPVPDVAPMPGAELRVTRVKDTADTWTVTIVDLVEGSSLHLAGVRIGDKLVRVDGRDALRFLQRHRIRPADAFPREVEIERDDTRHVLDLGK